MAKSKTTKITVLPTLTPVEVESVMVNDGSNQRSMVSSITVSFNQRVNASESAFTLRHRGDDTAVESTVASFDDSSGKTVVTLTFLPGPYVDSRSNGIHSLIDGNYDLLVSADLVHGHDHGPIPMLADFLFGDRQEDHLFRLFGDFDGDRDVDGGADLSLFAATFRLNNTSPDYNPHFDVDGDGDVDGGEDLSQFAQRFRRDLPFYLGSQSPGIALPEFSVWIVSVCGLWGRFESIHSFAERKATHAGLVTARWSAFGEDRRSAVWTFVRSIGLM